MSAIKTHSSHRRLRSSVSVGALSATLAVLLLAGCRPGYEGTRVAGWSLVDPSQRHPIMVSQQPSTLSIKVNRASAGLAPQQRAQVIGFLERYRRTDAGNSRLIIEAPGGTANEVAAMQGIAEIRHLMEQIGFDPSAVSVEAYRGSRAADAPIRISYLKYVAEGPECGNWPTNLARSEYNLNYPNFGCANQANFAAQVSNPADLLGPRQRGPGSGERSHEIWDKYVKGESTIAAKKGDETVKVGK